MKDRIVEEARALAERNAALLEVPLRASCLLHAHATIVVAGRHGLRLLLQAGTFRWPYVAAERDDGVSATHFSYEFSTAEAEARVRANLLPEMHVWAGDAERMEIVDLTTRWLPEQARALLGPLDWSAPLPPDHLWGKPPERVIYAPDEAATWLAVSFLGMMLNDLVQAAG